MQITSSFKVSLAVVQQVVSNTSHAGQEYCYAINHSVVSKEPLGALAHEVRATISVSFHCYYSYICLHSVCSQQHLKAFLERELPLCLGLCLCVLPCLQVI